MQAIKKVFLIFLFNSTAILSFSQHLMIKEQYDALEDISPNNMGIYKFINATDIENFPIFDYGNNQTVKISNYDDLLGDRFAYVFASFLTMYKTTGDKAYLHKFISQTYFVQQFRNDKQIGGVNPNNNGKKNV